MANYNVKISREVAAALSAGLPVVALESTIISHGESHLTRAMQSLIIRAQASLNGPMQACPIPRQEISAGHQMTMPCMGLWCMGHQRLLDEMESL